LDQHAVMGRRLQLKPATMGTVYLVMDAVTNARWKMAGDVNLVTHGDRASASL
jgi:hypothetical protein